MGYQIARTEKFNRKRLVSKSRFLPDTCQIRRVTASDYYFDSSDSGSFYPNISDYNDTGSYLTYEGSTNIPCRVDEDSRYVKTDEPQGQEAMADRYRFYVPSDVELMPDDLVVYDDRDYTVLRVTEDSAWNELTRAYITIVRAGYNA